MCIRTPPAPAPGKGNGPLQLHAFFVLPVKTAQARPPSHHLPLASCAQAEDEKLRINDLSPRPGSSDRVDTKHDLISPRVFIWQ